MPDLTVVTPAAVVPADRLTLGSCDARVDSEQAQPLISIGVCGLVYACMAEE